jgi:hypothetical protein
MWTDTIVRARHLSLSWLIIGVIIFGHMHSDYMGTGPQSSGFIRLGRDFIRKFAVREYAESASNSTLAPVLRNANAVG